MDYKLNQLPSSLLLGGALLLGIQTTAHACGTDDYLGSVCATAATFCPEGTLEANGQMLMVSNYQPLAEYLRNTYGGDGVKTFQLPNLQGRSIVGVTTTSPPPSDTLPIKIGQTVGSPTTTLSVQQMPEHTHSFSTTPINVASTLAVNSGNGTSSGPSTTSPSYLAASVGYNVSTSQSFPVNSWSNSLGTNPVNIQGLSTTVSGGLNATIRSPGGGKSVNTQSPALGLHYCIVVQGYAPVPTK